MKQIPRPAQAKRKTSSKCSNLPVTGTSCIVYEVGLPQGTCITRCANSSLLAPRRFDRSHPVRLKIRKFTYSAKFGIKRSGFVQNLLFSSYSQMFGTSPEFNKLLMSSKKDSLTICESVNKKVHCFPLTPVCCFNILMKSLKLCKL